MSWLATAARFASKAGSLVSGTAVAAQSSKKISPSLEDEVTVEVVGQPGATKKQLYYLGLATAFGLVKRYDIAQWAAPPPGLIMLEYDASDHWVRVTVKFKTSMLSAAVAATGTDWASIFAGGFPAGSLLYAGAKEISDYLANRPPNQEANKYFARLPIYSGPSDSVLGGSFDFTGRFAPGVPNVRDAPKLPFAGRVILTTEKTVDEGFLKPSITTPPGSTGPVIASPNPLPPGDHRSRGAIVEKTSLSDNGLSGTGTTPDPTAKLIPLIFAALSAPGSQDRMTYREPDAGVNGK